MKTPLSEQVLSYTLDLTVVATIPSCLHVESMDKSI